MSTSMPCVNMFSACLICSLSLPLATCTFSSAPISLQCFSTRSLSRCQRSSFKVSIEKPILIGSFGPLVFLAPPSLVCLVPDTQAPVRSAKRNKRTARVELRIDLLFSHTRCVRTVEVEAIVRALALELRLHAEHFGIQTRPF